MQSQQDLKQGVQQFFSGGSKKQARKSNESAISTSQEHLLASPWAEEQDNPLGTEIHPQNHAFLSYLPTELILCISELLDQGSLLALKNTNRRFQDAISISGVRISRCARWKMLCYLERDLMDRDEPLPNRLACFYCKDAHAKEEFTRFDNDVGHGVRRLHVIQTSQPEARFCWRWVPTTSLHYLLRIEDVAAITPTPPKSVYTYRWICEHCGERIIDRDENNKLYCRMCSQVCKICSSRAFLIFEFYGFEHPLEACSTLAKNHQLQTQDSNDIPDPPKPPPPEPEISRDRSLRIEVSPQFTAEHSLVHRSRVRRNRVPLSNPFRNSLSLHSSANSAGIPASRTSGQE